MNTTIAIVIYLGGIIVVWKSLDWLIDNWLKGDLSSRVNKIKVVFILVLSQLIGWCIGYGGLYLLFNQ